MFLIVMLLLFLLCIFACFFFYRILEIEKDIDKLYDLHYELEQYNFNQRKGGKLYVKNVF